MEFASRFRVVTLVILTITGLVAGSWALLRTGRSSGPATVAPLLGHGRIMVEVLNVSGKQGAARAATRALRAAGFDVVYFGTVLDTIETTEVLARRGDSGAAVRVARELGAGVARLKRDTLLRVDVTVRLGRDYKPPAGLRP